MNLVINKKTERKIDAVKREEIILNYLKIDRYVPIHNQVYEEY